MRIIPVVILVLMSLSALQAQNVSKLAKEYKKLSKDPYMGDNQDRLRELAEEIYTGNTIKYGIDHSKTREAYMDHLQRQISYSTYHESDFDISASVTDYFDKRAKVGARVTPVNSYQYIVYDPEGDAYNDLIYIVVGLFRSQYQGISSSFQIDTDAIKLYDLFLDSRGKQVGNGHPVFQTELILFLNLMQAAKDRGTEAFDSRMEQINTLLRDTPISGDLKTEFVPYCSILLQYQLDKEMDTRAEELLEWMVSAEPMGSKKKTENFPEFRNENDSFWNKFIYVDYPTLFEKLESKGWSEQLNIYKILLKSEGIIPHDY